jgi:hypothetical protein
MSFERLSALFLCTIRPEEKGNQMAHGWVSERERYKQGDGESCISRLIGYLALDLQRQVAVVGERERSPASNCRTAQHSLSSGEVSHSSDLGP